MERSFSACLGKRKMDSGATEKRKGGAEWERDREKKVLAAEAAKCATMYAMFSRTAPPGESVI